MCRCLFLSLFHSINDLKFQTLFLHQICNVTFLFAISYTTLEITKHVEKLHIHYLQENSPAHGPYLW